MKKSVQTSFVLLIAICLAMLLAATQVFEGDPDTAKVEDLYQQTDRALSALQWPKAEALVNRALEIEPENPLLLAQLAGIHDARGEAAEVETATQKATAALATASDEHRNLVLLRLATLESSFDQARIDSLMPLLRNSRPDDTFVLFTAAGLAQQRGDDGEAESLWRRILGIDPNHTSVYNQLGYLAAGQGRYDEAIDLLRKRVFLAPGIANAHDSLGEVLFFTGHYEEAFNEYRKAVDLQPDLYFSRLGLGRILLGRGQVEQALEVLTDTRRLLEGTRRIRDIDRTMIGLYYANGFDEKLISAVDAYAERWPDDFFVTGRFTAMRTLVEGRPRRAVSIHDSTLTVWRSLPQYENNELFRKQVDGIDLRFRAEVAARGNDHPTAAEYWSRELDVRDDRAPHLEFYSRYRLGLALAEAGRCAQALEQTRYNLRVNPRLIRTMILQARCCLDTGKIGKAQETTRLLALAIEDSDSDFFARRELADLNERLAAEGAYSP